MRPSDRRRMCAASSSVCRSRSAATGVCEIFDEEYACPVEDYRNIAIIRPTEANVRRYMELEASVVRQASYFSEVAQRVHGRRRSST
jgi:hypothetical protein